MTGPTRGVLLIKPVQTEESLPGGLIVLPDAARERMAADQVQILEVGPPEICENEACSRPHETEIARNGQSVRVHPTDPRLIPDAWALVQPRSFVDSGFDGERRLFARQDDVRAVLSIVSVGK